MNRGRVLVYYSGRVQGVGFRYTVKALARGFEITGTIRNLPDGRVELVADGVRAELEVFRQAVRESEVGRFVRQEETAWIERPVELRGFEIVH